MVFASGSFESRAGQASKANEMLKRLEELAQRDTKALYSLAVNYAELGRENEAISVLQKCFDQREERIASLNIEPRLAALKGHPRFQEIVRTLNLRCSFGPIY